MTDRQLLEQEIAEYKDRAQKTQDQLARLQAQLDALPKERVRLRARKHARATISVFASDNGADIADVWEAPCEVEDIDPAALAAHICRFGEPDVTREMEAVVEAARKVQLNNRPLQLRLLDAALAALDAARKGGA